MKNEIKETCSCGKELDKYTEDSMKNLWDYPIKKTYFRRIKYKRIPNLKDKE